MVSGCAANKLQVSYYIDSIIGISPDSKFGTGSKLYTIRILKDQLSGNMLASVQVSILALKYCIFFFWVFTFYAKLVTRCCGSYNLVSAWVDLIFICKQNEASLEPELISDWSNDELCTEALPTFNWYALGCFESLLYSDPFSWNINY